MWCSAWLMRFRWQERRFGKWARETGLMTESDPIPQKKIRVSSQVENRALAHHSHWPPTSLDHRFRLDAEELLAGVPVIPALLDRNIVANGASTIQVKDFLRDVCRVVGDAFDRCRNRH
jgi:hypothetical protein